MNLIISICDEVNEGITDGVHDLIGEDIAGLSVEENMAVDYDGVSVDWDVCSNGYDEDQLDSRVGSVLDYMWSSKMWSSIAESQTILTLSNIIS